MTAAVVLAAGGSTRMGRPKPLLHYDGRSLLHRTVDAAMRGGCAPVIVVLGAAAETLRPELAGLPVEIAINEGWAEGLAGSIRTGVETLLPRRADVDAVLLLPCDLPHISARLVRELLAAAGGAGAAPIVACTYAGTAGVPALFHRRWFDELCELRGDCGAKPLLLAHAESLVRVPWPEGALDVDEPADHEKRGGPSD